MTANTPATRKAKGRKFQQYVRDRLVEVLGIDRADVESRSMGAQGEDLILSSRARTKFPFSPEIKCTEKLNVWAAYDQALANGGDYTSVVIMKKNRSVPLIIVDLETFLSMQRMLNERKTD